MTDPSASVARALTTDPPLITPDDLPALLAAGVAGEVRQRLPHHHPLREPLRADHLQLGLRHAAIRSEVQTLLRHWAQAGIPVMPIKGFALAEFEYGTPGERFYGDVDVLIPDDPLQISKAVHLALALGWRSDGQHAQPARWTHECAHLFSPGGNVRLDVHRFVVAWKVGSPRRTQRLTQAIWEQAHCLDWHGVRLWRPAPVDAALINVVLGRCWGGDAGGLKPADYADLRVLMRTHGLTPAHLEGRARSLGALHTWQAFRQVCDPTRSCFLFGQPETSQVLLCGVRRDGHHPRRLLWLVRAYSLPARLRWMPRLLPDVLQAFLALRRGGNPQTPLHRWSRPASRRLPPAVLGEVMGAVAWWTRLLYPRQSRRGTCVPRAYATYRALHRLGHPAVFCSGVARTPSGVQGHAWIEDEWGEIEVYGEPLVRQRFREVFRFPKLAPPASARPEIHSPGA
ncbi:lasso peptide biosynthesis B2 protein [Deinococcus hohokamensis]|uniref:Lasso peptide biosynthesis B2 protein n=1 Tax=Deinococcus hohokamensis TaxID=309883 RepID=A0ABV9IBR0_9DEIO